MLHGPRAPFKRSSVYGNRSGSISPLLGAPPGWRLQPFARAPTTFNIVDQHRVRSGPARRRYSAAGPHKGSLERRPQPGQGDSSYADSPDTARPTSPSPLVGVQPRGAASSPKFHGRDANIDV